MSDEMDPFTYRVIGAAIEVHREMGPGLLESVYQKCLEKELTDQGFEFIPQAKIPLKYKGEIIGEELAMDFFFPGRLVLEAKALERIHPVHEAQLLTYLRLSKTKVGLLINFNVVVLKSGIKRMVL